MKSFHVTRVARTLALTSMLLLALVVSFQTPTPTYARIVSCKGDPKVTLSNGKTIVVAETISTDASNLKSVVYSFHLPAGVAITKIVKSDTGISAREVYNFYYDAPANTYGTDLGVLITGPAVAVSANMSIGNASTSASGQTGQHLIMKLVVK